MNRHFVPQATSRARWLAELSAALDDAQTLLARLVTERNDQGDADHLRMRIEELRSELRSLHWRGFTSNERIDIPRPLHPGWHPLRD
jgi:hypothetical protein